MQSCRADVRQTNNGASAPRDWRRLERVRTFCTHHPSVAPRAIGTIPPARFVLNLSLFDHDRQSSSSDSDGRWEQVPLTSRIFASNSFSRNRFRARRWNTVTNYGGKPPTAFLFFFISRDGRASRSSWVSRERGTNWPTGHWSANRGDNRRARVFGKRERSIRGSVSGTGRIGNRARSTSTLKLRCLR